MTTDREAMERLKAVLVEDLKTMPPSALDAALVELGVDFRAVMAKVNPLRARVATATAGEVTMADFREFAQAVEARFESMSERELFVVDLGDVDLFDVYLAAFPAGSNPIFRQRTGHDCSCCKQFVRNLGHVVAISDGTLQTVWACGSLPEPYATVARKLDEHVRALPIQTVFRTTEKRFGISHNYDKATVQRWNHFVGYVGTKHQRKDPGAHRSAADATAQVLRRGLEELSSDALDTVVDLIESNNLYRGEEHKAAVVAFRQLHRAFPRVGAEREKAAFVWSRLEDRAARFRNTVIGTLVTDLSSGMDVEHAVKAFETKVAPTNYKRPTALLTPRMIEDAVATIETLGLTSALRRRYAKITDVSVNNVLWVDNAVRGQMRDGLAGLLMEEVRAAPVNIKDAEQISADDFVARILPQARSIEVQVENRHLGNFVSLTAPAEPGVAKLFKWHNDFAWSYDGEVADSIKERVKKAGGNVDARLRVSLGWFNYDDLDLHVELPSGEHVFFANKAKILDVDMNAGTGHTREPVENLAWTGRLADGPYRVWAHQWCRREAIDVGFEIEVAYAGTVQQFSYAKAVPQAANVPCFAIEVWAGEVVSIKADKALAPRSASINKWDIDTQTLVEASTILLSPNHWDGENVGNKHLFFILKGCKNPDGTRGIYNEFLRGDLDKHRKVFEVLGAKTKCPPADEQLSGVGFSSTRGDTVNVVVKGPRFNRAFTITF